MTDEPERNGEWPAQPSAPIGAPNVLLILLDDVGFGAASGFGGPIDTPVFDGLGCDGLRFNQFHTTAVCSPTRAALLTGRNPPRVAFNIASGNEVPQRGYYGIWPRSTACVADVMRRNGYSTAAFGKWHNTPNWECSPVGPFDRWPTGLGFEYFYGFQGGEADHWRPVLYRHTSIAPIPPKPAYHLSVDIADDAISWLHTHQALAPTKPYFLYFAPGATHAPHHVPPEWIEPYRGRFDMGWDRLREETFARQKRLGVVPQNALLTSRPRELPSWASRSGEERRLVARQMEVYAAFLTQTDYEIGRVVAAARQGPGSENLMIIYIMGDNGTSAEGGMHGSDHNLSDIFYGIGADDVATQLARADALGSEALDNHFAIPWAWALDTPFQWMKQVASHLGGTRNPMVISWPGHIADPGGLRQHFTHVIDVVPTLYEVTGMVPPEMVDGVPQQPLDGVSFARLLCNREEKAPPRTQYFEMLANRAIYQDGWMACAMHCVPWQLHGRSSCTDEDKWELYNLDEDFTQAVDLSARFPDRLECLKSVFLAEAARNDVLPMVPNIGFDTSKPSLEAGRREFVFHRDTAPIPSLSGAPVLLGPHRLVAEVLIPERAASGIIVSNGGREGGFVLMMESGHLIYQNNFGGKHWDVIRSEGPLAAGARQLVLELVREGEHFLGRISVDGVLVGKGAVKRIAPPSYLGAFSIGQGWGSAVGRNYRHPFPFAGEINQVRIYR